MVSISSVVKLKSLICIMCCLAATPAWSDNVTGDMPTNIAPATLLALHLGATFPVIGSSATTSGITPACAPIPIPTTITSNSAARLPDPRLKPGFGIDIVVIATGRKEFVETGKRVSDDGSLTLPLVGTVQVEGLTLKELAAVLQTKYSVFLRSPQVDVDYNLAVAGAVSPWGSVTVLGTVKNPGSVNIPQTKDLTVSRAIQSVGGFDVSANESSIRISRRLPDGTIKKISVNLRSLGSSGETKQDIKLEAGDVIFVPEEIF